MRKTASRLMTGVVALLVAETGRVAGHVDYVTDPVEGGDAVPFLLEVFANPLNVLLLGGGGVSVVVVAATYLYVRPARRDIAVFRAVMDDYRDLLPWLLRLSFGLPLVGAGFAGYLFSPSVALEAVAVPGRLFQITVGFLLLFGLATRVAAAMALFVYLVGAVSLPELALANEYVPGLIAIFLLGSGRPSADHVLERLASAEKTIYGELDPVYRVSAWFNRAVDPYEIYVPTVVRAGLGFNFVFLGITQKLLSPDRALAVIGKYDLTAVVPVDAGLWVVGAGLTEAALGMALVVGLFTRAGSLVALTIFTLTLFGLPDDPVLAHITLFGLASLLLITGPGPFALDGALRDRVEARRGEPQAASADP
ncbi:MAG: DoxX family protein [Haloarculaceae archaeon]